MAYNVGDVLYHNEFRAWVEVVKIVSPKHVFFDCPLYDVLEIKGECVGTTYSANHKQLTRN